MRVVLATFGTAGDVGPFVHIGSALKERGHEVVLITDVAHRALAAARDVFALTPIRRYDPKALTSTPAYASPSFGPYRLWRDVFLPLVPEMFAAVGEALQTPTDVVLVHPWCFGALYAAERHGAPAASVAMAPVTWWSVDDPAQYSDVRPPAWLHRAILRWPLRWLLNGLFGAGLKRARAHLGLPPVRQPFFAMGRDVVASYALWPELMRGPFADDPVGATFCGFVKSSKSPLSTELEQFLSEGEPPVVVGVGSLLPAMANDVYEMAREAISQLGLRAVLVGADPRLARPDVFVAAHVPYGPLFRRARAVVHHGGAGTLSEALRAGKPQVLVPFGNDQYDNAWRAEQLNVGQSMPRTRLKAARLRQLLKWALQPVVAQRAAELGATLEGQRDAADLLVDDLERRLFSRRAPATSTN